MLPNSIKKHATQIAEMLKMNIWSSAEHLKPALNIVYIYGRSESIISSNQVLEGWKQILNELSLI